MAIDSRAVGPAEAARRLRLCGFTPREAERLVALKARRERGEVDELTDEARRALFVRWLVEHGRFTDWPDGGPTDGRTG
jgi:hypothetical protein